MTREPDLFSLPRPPASVAFGGASYDAKRDYERLDCQLAEVFRLMRDGQWRTLSEIARDVRGSQAGVSARLRDLKKQQYGGHQVPKEYVGDGVWRYRLIVNKGVQS